MKGSAGSVAVSRVDGSIAMTPAPGGVVMLFGANGSPKTTLHRADISGVAASATGFTATDGQGAVWAIIGDTLQPLTQNETLWTIIWSNCCNQRLLRLQNA